MAHEFDTPLPIAHKEPQTFVECYDNCTLLLEYIGALFMVLSEAHENRDSGAVAYLGAHLCEELGRRMGALFAAHASRTQKASTGGKEG